MEIKILLVLEGCDDDACTTGNVGELVFAI